MWHDNVKVQHYYVTAGEQSAFAIIQDLNGWKRVQTGSPDGVSNVGRLLSTAKAHDRSVRVYIDNDRIEQVMMS